MTTTSNHTTKMTPEEILARREEAKKVFSPPPNGQMNVEAIRLLIEWAEADEEMRQRRFAGWGNWDQGHWSLVTTDSANVARLAHVDESQAVEIVDDLRKNGACGTAYCMAGQTVVQAGYDLVFENSPLFRYDGAWGVNADVCEPVEHNGQFNQLGLPVFVAVGSEEPICDVAEKILGLTSDEADRFFNGENTIDRLKVLANTFCAERGNMVQMYPTHGTYDDPGTYDDFDDTEDY